VSCDADWARNSSHKRAVKHYIVLIPNGQYAKNTNITRYICKIQGIKNESRNLARVCSVYWLETNEGERAVLELLEGKIKRRIARKGLSLKPFISDNIAADLPGCFPLPLSD